MSAIMRYLGHGRALETFLSILKTLIGVTILFSDLGEKTPVLADLTWLYPNTIIAAPFLIVGFLQLCGVLFNMAGYEWSWVLRSTAALLALFMWTTFLTKSGLLGESSFMFPLAIACLPASAFLLYKSWNRLPIPGAVGLV